MPEEEIRDPHGLLEAYNKLKEEIRRITTERDEAVKQKDALAKAAEDNEWRSRALVAEVKSQLSSKGLKDPDRLIKVLGTDGLDFDEEGKLKGLDERLSTATKDFPELFDPKTKAGGKADAFATGDAEPKADPIRDAVHSALQG